MEFKIVWDRLTYDLKYGLFLSHPYEQTLIERNRGDWQKKIMTAIEGESYVPHNAFYCNVPKKGGLIRPGSHLEISDHFYYLYLLSHAYQFIFNELKWSQGKKDFAYVLTGNVDQAAWLQNQFDCWLNYRTRSIELLNEGFPYVITTDITGYYENIDHSILYSDLRAVGVPDKIALAIKACLKKWAIVQGKGLPQACSASHILAKLYLNSIDIALNDSGINHLRYVDDYRIYCKSKQEAKIALKKLIELTRLRGLNLQSAKTKILRSEEARQSIEGIQLIIESISNKIRRDKPAISILIDSPSLSVSDDFPVAYDITTENREVLEETFRAYFIEGSESNFDKTLFHYLLSRLSDFKSTFALEYSLSILEQHPEETDYILKYAKKIEGKQDAVTAVTDFLSSPLAIYSYQNYQIVRWVNDNLSSIPEALLGILRTQLHSNNTEWFLTAQLRRSLALFGNQADLQYLVSDYQNNRNDLERAETMINVRRLEKSQRNAFFARTIKDSPLVELAQGIAK